MHIIIVGVNEISKAVINSLSLEKNRLVIIEQKKDIAQKMEAEIESIIINGDATDISILKDAGLNDADAIIICTKDDKTNLMISEISKENKIPMIITVVNSPKNEVLFSQLGITHAISFVNIVVSMIQKELTEKKNINILAQIAGGSIQIIEVTLSSKSKIIGKKISELKHYNILSISRNGQYITVNEEDFILDGDVLIISVESNRIDEIIAGITKK